MQSVTPSFQDLCTGMILNDVELSYRGTIINGYPIKGGCSGGLLQNYNITFKEEMCKLKHDQPGEK